MGKNGMKSIADISLKGKTVLVRGDLNVPMSGGRVTDDTRIRRLLPTLEHLLKQQCKVVLLSHFGRPKGQYVPSLSLAPLVDPISNALGGVTVKFGVDSTGPDAKLAVDNLKAGEILLLENLRFHAEEEAGDNGFAKALASLGDAYVNDAFSASHRAHASIVAITKHLPSYAGFLMQEEVTVLSDMFDDKMRPLAAIIGGSKISTKLALLTNLSKRMDYIMIGGAMAHTFLMADGIEVGKSLCEEDMISTAKEVMKTAKKNGCTILLPTDFVVAEEFEAHTACQVVDAHKIPKKSMAIDVGPDTVAAFAEAVKNCKAVFWNGPLGAFETSPFDVSTVSLARTVAALTKQKKLRSIAGGGDTVAAINHSGLAEALSYVSTAGGAFLEWLEGKTLPGVEALQKKSKAA